MLEEERTPRILSEEDKKNIELIKKKPSRLLSLLVLIKEKVSLLEKMNEYGCYFAKKNSDMYEGKCHFTCKKEVASEEDSCGGEVIINPDKGVFYCFKCLKGGDIISFICEYHHISVQDALNQLSFDYIMINEAHKEISC